MFKITNNDPLCTWFAVSYNGDAEYEWAVVKHDVWGYYATKEEAMAAATFANNDRIHKGE
jgi:hypothetical protein